MSSSIGFLPPVFRATQGQSELDSILQIVEQPAGLIAAGNKACIILNSLPKPEPFIAASFAFTVNGLIFEGNNFTLTSEKLGSLNLIAKDSPSILEFKTTASPANSQEIAEDIAGALNDSILFNRFYVASAFVGGGRIEINALNVGSDFSLSFGSIGSFIVNSNNSGTDETEAQSREGYSNYVQIFAGNNFTSSFGEAVDKDIFCLISQSEKNYRQDNSYEFDITGALKDEFLLRPPNFMQPNPVYNPLLPYFVLWGEAYKENTQVNRKTLIGTTAVKWATPAALQYVDYEFLTGLDPEFVVIKSAADVCFSTNQPLKVVSKEAKELLTIITKANPADLFRIILVTVTPTFLDGSIGVEQFVKSGFTNSGGAYTFNVSPEGLPLDSIEALAGKDIDTYTIQFRYATTLADLAGPLAAPLVTKPQVYKLSEPCQSVNICFLSSFGFFDCFEFVGDSIDSAKSKGSDIVKTLPCSPNSSSQIRSFQNVDVEPSTNLSSSYFDEVDYKWLLELAAAPVVYRVEPNNTLTAIKITSLAIREDKTIEKYFIELDYIKSLVFNSVTI